MRNWIWTLTSTVIPGHATQLLLFWFILAEDPASQPRWLRAVQPQATAGKRRNPSATCQFSCHLSPLYLPLGAISDLAKTLVEQSMERGMLPWANWEPSALSWVKELPWRHLGWCQTIWAPFRRNVSPGDISPTVPWLFEKQGEGEAWLPWLLCSSKGDNVWLLDATALPDTGCAMKQAGSSNTSLSCVF